LEDPETAEHDIFIKGVKPASKDVESLHEGLLGWRKRLSSSSGRFGWLAIYFFVN
jgi:hypothetical protein